MNETDTPRSAYREFPPAGPVPAAVCAWEQAIAPGRGYVQRVLPDGCADVVVTAHGQARLVGPTAEPALVRLAPGGTVRGLRLRTAVIGAALGCPVGPLRDADVPLEDALPSGAARRLAEQVWCGDPPELPLRRRADGRVRAALRAIGTPAGPGAPAPSVRGAAEAAGVSERHLRRLLADATGLDPRALQRVMRLQRFLALADAAPGLRAADLAAQAGYADQPHLTREVRRMSGLTPAVLLRERAAGRGAPPPPGAD
ncbi:helix-turn-helix domain-containing protein [Nocardiopsis halophila]|uniref:helix-turn-helix domain-containing protein n=1 Tax=Nocardiopsis halophila TaxID=141692 RepID=UPI00034848FB|nr:helix-turn-helix domain-containing protein [Nocardiopsis halophila]